MNTWPILSMLESEKLTEDEVVAVIHRDIVSISEAAVGEFRNRVSASNVTKVAIGLAETGLLNGEMVPPKIQANMIQFLLGRVVPSPRELIVKEGANRAAAWVEAEGR